MPASTSTMLTLAHAKASARLPNSVMSAQTATPTTQAVRKQPSRNTATGPGPAARTFRPNTQAPITDSRTKMTKPRSMPTSQAPAVR